MVSFWPREYYLAGNRLSAGQFNIQIRASQVDLDLRGKAISYAGPSGSQSFGIQISGRNDIRVRNGSIFGSQFGIIANNAHYLTVENVDFTNCRYIGVSINAATVGAAIRACKFAAITGWNAEAYAIGVNGLGINGIVEHCMFMELYRQPGALAGLAGEGCGVIVSSGATGAKVRYNWFHNSQLQPKRAIGVWVAEQADAIVCDNALTNFGGGIASMAGQVYRNQLWMRGAQSGSSGVFLATGEAHDNCITGYETPLDGGAAMTNNTVI